LQSCQLLAHGGQLHAVADDFLLEIGEVGADRAQVFEDQAFNLCGHGGLPSRIGWNPGPTVGRFDERRNLPDFAPRGDSTVTQTTTA
jgi:hypothetical protein